MQIEQTSLNGVVVLTPARFGDSRGFFSESWSQGRMEQAGLNYHFVQDNHSLSSAAGTVRGLHFQAPPHAQAKLVRCGRGRFLDVVVDIRKGSPTFGQWVAEELSFENGKQLLIPRGFLHGFATLEPNTEIIYRCDDVYALECDGAVRFDDPDIGIEWGLGANKAILSEKDAAAPLMKDFDSPFNYKETTP